MRTGDQKLVDLENVLGDFIIEAISCAASSQAVLLLAFPEDLRKARLGTPASLWRDPTMLQLAETDLPAGGSSWRKQTYVIGDFVMDTVKAAASSRVLVLLAFPEDLGKARLGSPASLWRRPAILQLAQVGLTRAALFHKNLSGDGPLKPTGILSNAEAVLELSALVHGWPSFDDKGKYTGPLPDGSRDAAPLIGKEAGVNMDTDAAVRDAPSVCMKLAAALLRTGIRR